MFLERYQQTAHTSKLLSQSITITNPIHPLHGQSVAVHSIRRLGKSIRVIIEHPNGGLLSLAASETSLELTSPPPVIEGQTPLFDPKKLLQLSQQLEKHTAITPSTVCFCQQTQKLGRKKNDGKTAPAPKHLARTGRAQETLNQPDGALSEQNPYPTSPDQQADGKPNS